MMQKGSTKGFSPRPRKTPSPVVKESAAAIAVRNRNSPVGRVPARTPPPGTRPRSGNKRRVSLNHPEHDDFLSLSESVAKDRSLNLQGRDLDNLKDMVKTQKIETDQAKGRKSPGNRGTIPRSSNKGSFNYNAGLNSKTVLVTTHREADSSDHNSDTTEVEKYNSVSEGGNEAEILKIAAQMDKNEIDGIIEALLHLKSLSVENALPTGSPALLPSTQATKRPTVVSQQANTQRRSKSGPPGLSSSRPPYPYSSTAQPQTSPRGCTADSHSLMPADSDNDGEEEEVRYHNDYDEYAFIPPAARHPLRLKQGGQPSFHRSESEASYTSNGGSRASTPNHSMHKRSPTPVSHNNTEHDCCPVVERSHRHSSSKQKPQSAGGEVAVPSITVTEFTRPGQLCIPPSSHSGGSIKSPRNSAFDDLSSVASSNSSFTIHSGAGSYSYPKAR